MKRRLVTVIVVLLASAGLVLPAFAGLRNDRRIRLLYAGHSGDRGLYEASAALFGWRVCLRFDWTTYPHARAGAPRDKYDGFSLGYDRHPIGYSNQAAGETPSWLGFGLGRDPAWIGNRTNRVHRYTLWLPVFVPALALMTPLGIIIARRLRRRRRVRRGLCAQCGYDLRGGQLTCPECGTPSPGQSPRTLSTSLA